MGRSLIDQSLAPSRVQLQASPSRQRRRWASGTRPTDEGDIMRSCPRSRPRASLSGPARAAQPQGCLGRSEFCGISGPSSRGSCSRGSTRRAGQAID